jgi:DNA-binding MarR family transcriptional regulator
MPRHAAKTAAPRPALPQSKAQAQVQAGKPDLLLDGLIDLVALLTQPLRDDPSATRVGLREWRTMTALAGHPASSASELARASGLDKMSVSRALAALERAGQVVRRTDPTDARRALVSLTPAGRRRVEALRRRLQAREALATAGMSSTDQARLTRLLAAASTALHASD